MCVGYTVGFGVGNGTGFCVGKGVGDVLHPSLQAQQNTLHPPYAQHGVPAVPSAHVPIDSCVQQYALTFISWKNITVIDIDLDILIQM